MSNHGDVAVFATPTDHILDDGYAVCSAAATSFDDNNTESRWGAATTTLMPVTIVRTTTDAVFTQKFAVDTKERT